MPLGVGVLCEHVFLQQDDECYLVWACCVNMCFCSRMVSDWILHGFLVFLLALLAVSW